MFNKNNNRLERSLFYLKLIPRNEHHKFMRYERGVYTEESYQMAPPITDT